VPTAMPVATGIHTDHPAGPSWTLASSPGPRRWLHELPSDHGPDNPATNPHRYPDDGPGDLDLGVTTSDSWLLPGVVGTGGRSEGDGPQGQGGSREDQDRHGGW
jgi:hypothetical protein